MANYATGLTWNVKGSADFKSLLDDLNGLKPSAAPQKTEEPPNRANLLSALNQGENITKGLKPVTADMKGKPVEETGKRQPSSIAQKKEEIPAVKPPKKYKNENWYVVSIPLFFSFHILMKSLFNFIHILLNINIILFKRILILIVLGKFRG